MRTLEEFQFEMVAALQRLGESPTRSEVEREGRELVKGGVPDGADFEGLLLLRDFAKTE